MAKEIFFFLYRDVLIGLSSLRYRFLFCLMMFTAMAVLSVYQLQTSAELLGMDRNMLTYTDLLFSLFQGVDYEIVEKKFLPFPFSWFLLQMMIPFLLGAYARDDLFLHTSFLFVRAKRRLSIWLAKVLFSLLAVILVFLSFLAVSWLIAAVFFSPDIGFREYGDAKIKPAIGGGWSAGRLTWLTIALPFLLNLCGAAVYTMFSLLIRPVYLFLIFASIYILSVYTANPFLPGSYGMILRHGMFDPARGFSTAACVMYFSVTLLAAGVIGYRLFKRADILYFGKD